MRYYKKEKILIFRTLWIFYTSYIYFYYTVHQIFKFKFIVFLKNTFISFFLIETN